MRLIVSCITQLKAQGPSRNCNESKKEEEEEGGNLLDGDVGLVEERLDPALDLRNRLLQGVRSAECSGGGANV